MNFRAFILVSVGSAIGGVLRYAASLLMRHDAFPFATLLINVIGSLIIGLVFSAGQRGGWLGGPQWLLLATGLCGGFTTFSSFSLENIRLLQAGNVTTAVLYTTASLALGIAACWLGIRVWSWFSS